jgi:hypothetical protein
MPRPAIGEGLLVKTFELLIQRKLKSISKCLRAGRISSLAFRQAAPRYMTCSFYPHSDTLRADLAAGHAP